MIVILVNLDLFHTLSGHKQYACDRVFRLPLNVDTHSAFQNLHSMACNLGFSIGMGNSTENQKSQSSHKHRTRKFVPRHGELLSEAVNRRSSTVYCTSIGLTGLILKDSSTSEARASHTFGFNPSVTSASITVILNF